MSQRKSRSWMRTWFLGGVGLIGAAYLLAVTSVMVRETSLVFLGSNNPDSLYIVPPDELDLSWDTLSVPSSDGARVVLLEARGDDSRFRPWALYFHGGGGMLGSPGNTNRYKLLLDAGFNVLAMEFRGYGAAPSEPPPPEGVLYQDARSAWHHLTETLGVESSQIILYAWSLGSGVATHLAAEVEPAALVTEGAFTALPEIGAARYPWIPVRLLMRNRFDNLSRAADVAVPWTLLHGRRDAEVPPEHARALADAAPEAHIVWLNAGHDDPPEADSQTMLSVLQKIAESATDERPGYDEASG